VALQDRVAERLFVKEIVGLCVSHSVLVSVQVGVTVCVWETLLVEDDVWVESTVDVGEGVGGEMEGLCDVVTESDGSPDPLVVAD